MFGRFLLEGVVPQRGYIRPEELILFEIWEVKQRLLLFLSLTFKFWISSLKNLAWLHFEGLYDHWTPSLLLYNVGGGSVHAHSRRIFVKSRKVSVAIGLGKRPIPGYLEIIPPRFQDLMVSPLLHGSLFLLKTPLSHPGDYSIPLLCPVEL